jgi:hypothetical protein
MIKITRATHLEGYKLELEFSDGTVGEYDLAPLVDRDSSLARPLREAEYFKSYYLELGALCWRNGLELRGGAIHRRLADAGLLRPGKRAVGQS